MTKHGKPELDMYEKESLVLENAEKELLKSDLSKENLQTDLCLFN